MVLTREYYLSDCEGFKQFKNSAGKVLSKRLKKIFSLAKIKPGMHILDIGCGRGELVLHSGLIGISLGIDNSDSALEIAYKTKKFWLKEFPFIKKRVLFLKADCQYLPIKDRCIEVVFLSDIIEHLSNEKIIKMLKEIFRILKGEGKIILHTSPNRIFLNYGLKLYYFLGRIFGKQLNLNWKMKKSLPFGCLPPIHINEQTIFSLRKLFKKTGFKKINLWLEKNSSYVYYFLKDDRFIRRINFLYKFFPFKHLFFADIYGIVEK